jgi:ABC-type spermidine/putrescine transport system permease subunit II
MIRLGVSPMVNALGTLIVVAPLIIVIIGTYFDRRSVS